MHKDRYQHKIQKLLFKADIKINDSRPWDIHVHHQDFYRRLISDRSLGLGESYMDGWWDCERIDEFISHILHAEIDTEWTSLKDLLVYIRAKVINLQKPSRAFRIGQHHYDLGNDLYKAMLGKRMIYSCAYWQQARHLDEAQEAKLDLVCQKLVLKPGMIVLDIGCGWGETAKYLAERYKVEVVGITVSKEQQSFAKDLCQGLPIQIYLQDYRDLQGQYDRILSLGMFEHVGYKNYRTYMQVVQRCLKPNGLFLLQTIGANKSYTHEDPWIECYIFPGALLPSAEQIAKAANGLFVLEDWHNFGPDYDKTLMAWYDNFKSHWAELKKDYDERFYRMWEYYLLASAGTFRSRRNQVWQIVFSPKGFDGRYQAPR